MVFGPPRCNSLAAEGDEDGMVEMRIKAERVAAVAVVGIEA